MARPKPKAYHHGDLRAALLAAADRIVRAQGIGALSLRQVARKAGVSHAAPYHHFRTRDHLLAAVAAAGFDRLRAEVDGALRTARPNPEAQWRAGASGYLRFVLGNGELYRIMFGDPMTNRAKFPEVATAARRAFEPLVAGARSSAPDVEPEELARTAWALLHGIAILALDGLAGASPVDREAVEAWAGRSLIRLMTARTAA